MVACQTRNISTLSEGNETNSSLPYSCRFIVQGGGNDRLDGRCRLSAAQSERQLWENRGSSLGFRVLLPTIPQDIDPIGISPLDFARSNGLSGRTSRSPHLVMGIPLGTMMNFQDLGLSEPIVRAVVSEGYETATPIQEQAIPHLVEGRDLLGYAQTGTGKTAAFALPILHRLSQAPKQGRARRIRRIILSPTRELASQIAQSFRVYRAHTNVRQTTVFGGVHQHAQVRALRQGADILVATPEDCSISSIRVLLISALSRRSFSTKPTACLTWVFFLILRRIIGHLPNERQTVLFSATMPQAIEQLATAILRGPVQIRLATQATTCQLIEQSVCFVPQNHKVDVLTNFLMDESISSAIVFTRTKNGADKVVKRLTDAGIQAKAIHGDKSQNARERAMASFKQNRTKVLVATDVASRGINVNGISHVFNFDLPEESESYVHRIGRTGRAGASGSPSRSAQRTKSDCLRDRATFEEDHPGQSRLLASEWRSIWPRIANVPKVTRRVNITSSHDDPSQRSGSRGTASLRGQSPKCQATSTL